jgi:hypothetical protein
VDVRIIEEETSILSDEDAARADELLAGQLAGLTFGEVRRAARKVVLKLDPEAVRKQKEAAKRDTHVRRFRENSGNGGMIGRELPSDEVLASWQHIEQRALDLRAAGLTGTLEDLRVRAYLDLLQERDSRPVVTGTGGDGSTTTDPGAAGPASDEPDPASGEDGAGDPVSAGSDASPGHGGGAGQGDGAGQSDGPGRDDGAGRDDGPGRGYGTGRGGSPRPGGSGGGPSLAAMVTLTVPLGTSLGLSDEPGEADGYGPLDGQDSRDLLAAAARDPRTRWCVTVMGSDGTATAHGCLTGRHPPPGPAVAGTGLSPPGGLPADIARGLRDGVTAVARGQCVHGQAEAGYRPSRKLRHLVNARNARCTAPGCGWMAVRCDLDHTVAWEDGGLTCECDLAPLCRHHHRCKQAEGWRLEQPEPGVLVWRTPAGRAYTTRPTRYSAA